MALVSVLGNSAEISPQTKANIPWINYSFRNQHFLARTSAFVLVPQLVFAPENAPSYLQLSGIDSPKCAFDEVHALKAFLVYPSEIGQAESHIISHLLNHLILTYCHDYPNFLHFHIDVDGLIVVVYRQGKLQMANRFKFKAKEDILYYISASANQFGIDLLKDHVSYSGFLRPKTALKNLLHQYIGHLEAFVPESEIQFDLAINPQHQYFYADVFTLALCAL